MVSFWERAAPSVDHLHPYVLFVFLLFVILGISRFGFEDVILVIIASVPAFCILYSYLNNRIGISKTNHKPRRPLINQCFNVIL